MRRQHRQVGALALDDILDDAAGLADAGEQLRAPAREVRLDSAIACASSGSRGSVIGSGLYASASGP
jgi:hypothetical protein